MPVTSYFIIAQPKCKYDEPRIDRVDKPIVTLNDAKKKKAYQAELIDLWTVEEKDFDAMNAISLMAYGMTASKLKVHMLEKYPQLKEEFEIEYWLLKRL